MTEREKIVEILKENFMARKEVPIMITHTEEMQVPIEIWKICQSIINGVVIPYFADTLIENGIGDIAEWKERAEVAENELVLHKKALNLLARKYLEVSGYYPCKIAVLAKEITIPTFLKQAEKEIEEDKQQ